MLLFTPPQLLQARSIIYHIPCHQWVCVSVYVSTDLKILFLSFHVIHFFLEIPFHWNLPFAKIVNSSLKSTPTQTTIPWCVSWCQKNVSVVLLSLFTKYFVTRWNFFWINNVINRINLAVTSYWFCKMYHLCYIYCQLS